MQSATIPSPYQPHVLFVRARRTAHSAWHRIAVTDGTHAPRFPMRFRANRYERRAVPAYILQGE